LSSPSWSRADLGAETSLLLSSPSWGRAETQGRVYFCRHLHGVVLT
jgi:hypothetical protein